MIYIVSYSTGAYEDYREIILFSTTKKSTATKYVTKFNKLVDKWYKYYSQYEQNCSGHRWIKQEYIEKYFNRWYKLKEINKAFYQEIEIR